MNGSQWELGGPTGDSYRETNMFDELCCIVRSVKKKKKHRSSRPVTTLTDPNILPIK